MRKAKKLLVQAIKLGGKAKVALTLAIMAVLANPMSAALVAQEADGTITFTPGDLASPIITAIIATVGAAMSIWLVVIGIKWIKRFVN